MGEVALEGKPNPRQREFFVATARHIGYGGARSGGKSWAMRRKFVLLCLNYTNFNALLLRRTFPELRENHVIPLLRELNAIAKYRGEEKVFIFPNGSRLKLGYCEHENDVYQYQGQEYDAIGLEEATMFTESQMQFLTTCNRSTRTDFKPRMYYTANPGGVGHCVPYGEVLTPSGWVDISQLKVGDPVYAVGENRSLVKTVVGQIHKHYYDGDLWTAHARGLEISCTPDHRIAKIGGTRKNHNCITLVAAKDLPGQTSVLRSVSYDGDAIESFTPPLFKTRTRKLEQPRTITGDQYVELMGWFLSEGYTVDRDKAFGIAQTKPEQVERIGQLLDECGFTHKKTTHGYIIYAADWWSYLRQFGKCRDKFISRHILNATRHQLQLFFKTAIDGDGHWSRPNSGQYYTISKQMADDMVEIGVKLGYAIYVSFRHRNNRNGLTYCVNFKPIDRTELLTGQHCYNVQTQVKKKINVKLVPFKGLVYDLGIPEYHTFVIRQGGTVWVSGNSWFKRLFIERDYRESEMAEDYVFIPARIYDNTVLMAAFPEYVKTLENLPEDMRRAHLEGDWDVFVGQFFREFSREKHVIPPFELPSHWRRFRSLDWGFNDYSAVYWHAIAPDKRVYTYRELYVNQTLASDLAEKIKELSKDEQVVYTVASPDMWQKRGGGYVKGESIADTFHQRGVYLRKADNNRVIGWQRCREFMATAPDGLPYWQIFENCANLIRTIPALIYDEHDSEDVDDSCEDHSMESARYALMSRPRPNPEEKLTISGTYAVGELRMMGYSDHQIRKLADKVKIIGGRR